MNVAMWGKAVRVIPRVSKDEWDSLDIVSRWLIATRSAVLVMTFNASAIAGLLALRDGKFHGLLWLMVTVGLLFAHATNNLINDFTDHIKGVDKDNYFRSQYGPQPLEHGLLTRGQLLLTSRSREPSRSRPDSISSRREARRRSRCSPSAPSSSSSTPGRSSTSAWARSRSSSSGDR